MVRYMDAGKQALHATWPVSSRGNPPIQVGFLYLFFPMVKKSSMPQSVKEHFTQDDIGTELILVPGPLLAREVVGAEGKNA